MLDALEFENLANVLREAALVNSRSYGGRPSKREFFELLRKVTNLSEKAPNWPELVYFTAWIADKARDSATAVTYYERVVPELDPAKQSELIASINNRLADLKRSKAHGFVAGATKTLEEEVDYSHSVKTIRNSGQEGSVVGQALATALELQILRATQEECYIGARHIYYMPRDATGTLDSDSGAYVKDAFDALATQGAVEEKFWPYVPGEYRALPPVAVNTARRFRIRETQKLENLDELRLAFSNNRPVVAEITVYQSFASPETTRTGVVTMPAPTDQVLGNHFLVIVGYNNKDKELKFVNSWGTEWGNDGFGYFPYHYIQKYMREAWTFQLAPPQLPSSNADSDSRARTSLKNRYFHKSDGSV